MCYNVHTGKKFAPLCKKYVEGGIFMKIIWLGQSGLLFVSGNKKIVVDPYLSDSLKKIDKRMCQKAR